MHDARLGFPPVLLLIEVPARPSRRAPTRPVIVPEYIADSRAMDSDKPKREEPAAPASNIAEGCFGVWRKTPPPVGVPVPMRWMGKPWGGPTSIWNGRMWAKEWEWFDQSATAEAKP